MFVPEFQTYHINMPNNKLTKTKGINEVRNIIRKSSSGFEAKYILSQVQNELDTVKWKKEVGPETFLYKSMTLFEFEKGPLLCTSIPERFTVFALEFSKQLQEEYKCNTPSEKSLAELAALNYVRVLSAQSKINSYLSRDSVTDIGVGYLNMMSKELDRAERHYLTSLEALKILHSPSFNVNIKTNTAVVGQNQAVQVKNA